MSNVIRIHWHSCNDKWFRCQMFRSCACTDYSPEKNSVGKDTEIENDMHLNSTCNYEQCMTAFSAQSQTHQHSDQKKRSSQWMLLKNRHLWYKILYEIPYHWSDILACKTITNQPTQTSYGMINAMRAPSAESRQFSPNTVIMVLVSPIPNTARTYSHMQYTTLQSVPVSIFTRK